MTHIICHPCAVVIENDDTSHINPDALPVIEEAINEMGWVTQTDQEEGRMFTCDCCANRTYGTSYTYEGAA